MAVAVAVAPDALTPLLPWVGSSTLHHLSLDRLCLPPAPFANSLTCFTTVHQIRHCCTVLLLCWLVSIPACSACAALQTCFPFLVRSVPSSSRAFRPDRVLATISFLAGIFYLYRLNSDPLFFTWNLSHHLSTRLFASFRLRQRSVFQRFQGYCLVQNVCS